MTHKLYKSPTLEGYSFTERPSVRRIKTKGGASSFRGDLEDASILVEARWVLTAQEWTNLRLFWKVGTNRGNDFFLVDLVIDSAVPAEYTAYWASEPKLETVMSEAFIASARLEILPVAVNQDYDESLCAVYEAAEGRPAEFLALLDSLVNSAWPAA